jgi:hypothetical protein
MHLKADRDQGLHQEMDNVVNQILAVFKGEEEVEEEIAEMLSSNAEGPYQNNPFLNRNSDVVLFTHCSELFRASLYSEMLLLLIHCG